MQGIVGLVIFFAKKVYQSDASQSQSGEGGSARGSGQVTTQPIDDSTQIERGRTQKMMEVSFRETEITGTA